MASLARLGLTDAEVESFRMQLSDVLDHISMLDKLDTSQIEPTAQILTQRNTSRPDEVVPSLHPEAVMLNSPRSEDGFIRVPAVLEDTK